MAFRREAVIKSAEKYVSRGKLEAAIKEYRKVLAHNPNDANTLNRVGDLYARIERFDEAVRLFSQIAEQYTRDGFFVKAIAIYKKIIKLDPTALQVYEKLAALYAKQGLINEARTQYQVLADYYQKHDNVASAITIYQRMAELEPDNPSYRLKLAELYASRQLIDKAMQEYRRLAEIFLADSSIDEATQVFLKALDITAQDLGFVDFAIGALRRAGRDGAAARVLAKAAELNPAAVQMIEAPAEAAKSARDRGEAEASPAAATALDQVALELSGTDVITFDDGLDDFAGDDDVFEVDLDMGTLPSIDEVLGDGTSAAASSDEGRTPDEGPTSEIFAFELDLDDDEIPSSLVTPPSDMLEMPFDGLGGVQGDQGADAAPVEPSGLFALEIGSLDSKEVHLEPAPTAPREDSVEIDLEFDLDFQGELSAADPAPPPIERLPPVVTEPAPAIMIEPRPIPEQPTVSLMRREEDLLAEAQVFAKYGLRQKAEERLEALRELRPDHLGGLLLSARLRLLAGEHQEAIEHAITLRDAARAADDLQPWEALRDELVNSGYTVDGDEVVAAPVDDPQRTSGRISQFLEKLDEAALRGEAPPVSPAPPPVERVAASRGAGELDLDETLAGLLDETRPADDLLPAQAKEAARSEQLPSAASAAEPPAAVSPTAAEAPQSSVAPTSVADRKVLDDSSMSWLDDVRAEHEDAAAADDGLFEEEDDFFDLAAELERELVEEETAEGGSPSQPQEQSLEDIVEGFKRGVAEHLSPEDYDTHFNLGIAYREMGLLDEAIGEFQLASKDERHLVEASSMLGICFLDKGLPELALKWYRKALTSPSIREGETSGLLYEMAQVYRNTGDVEAARKTLVEIYGMNSNFRDVAALLDDLAEDGT